MSTSIAQVPEPSDSHVSIDRAGSLSRQRLASIDESAARARIGAISKDTIDVRHSLLHTIAIREMLEAP
jgi:hypothetical protein